MSNYGWRPHIESALCLNIGRLLRTGTIKPDTIGNGSLHWTNSQGANVGSVGFRADLSDDRGELELEYTADDHGQRKAISCRLELVTLPCHYGGRRWLAVCPYTRRRALKLYKWPDIDWFCHREAIRPRPAYASQRASGNGRIIEQRWALRRRLRDDTSNLFGEPIRPKGMHWRTFERFLARDSELAAREWRYAKRLLGMNRPGFRGGCWV